MGSSHTIKNVLIIRLSALGDVAMTIPVIYSLCRAYPDINFTMLTTPVVSRIFINRPENLQLYKAEIRGRHAGVKGVYTLYNELKKHSFDAIADLHNVLRSRLLCFLFRLSRVKSAHIDKNRRGKKKLTSRYHKQLKQLPTSFQRYTDVFRTLGFTFPEDFTSVYTSEKETVSEIFPSIGDTDVKRIGIAPFAKHKGKIYPIDKMEEVVSKLAESKQYKLFLFGGGENETVVLKEWERIFPDSVISLAGMNLGFSGELALMSHLDLLVSMDSGNMHLASLVGIPVVSVWGATHPYAGFLGWKQSPENTVQLDLSCRPCSVYGNRPCWRGDYACLNDLPPEMILNKIKNVIYAKK